MRRAILTLGAMVIFSLYVVVNHALNGRPAPTLETPLDRAIPFWPPAEFVYCTVYVFIFLPVAQVRDPRIFTRVALAFYTYNLLAVNIFWLFPVRYDRPVDFPIDSVSTWGVALNYFCDPPYNNFPSLHVTNAVFASLVALRVDRPVGIVASALAVAISVSTLLVKEHWIADILGGALLGYAAYRLMVFPAIPRDAPPGALALPRRYVALVAAVCLTLIAALVVAYHLGWQPFPWPLPRP